MANLEDILSRARVIATGIGGDANLSPVIDNKPAFRALLDTALSYVFNNRAKDRKNWRNIAVKHTITFAGGVGALPPEVMREYLHMADFANTEGDLISYLTWTLDNRATFSQLGYMYVDGDNLIYTAPGGTPGTYDGDISLTVPSLPDLTADPLDMTGEIFDDVCHALALAVRGELTLT